MRLWNRKTWEFVERKGSTGVVIIAAMTKDKKVIFIGNLSKSIKSFTIPIEGFFTDYMSGEKLEFTKNQKLNFNPWEYKILIVE